MKNLLVILTSLIICQFLYSQTPLKYIDPLDTYQRASTLYSEGKNQEALDLLREINENDSIYLSAIARQTEILIDEKKYDEVIELCDLHLQKDSKQYFELSINKGLALLRNEKYTAAIDFYNILLNRYPKSYLIMYNLGVIYEMLEDFDNAIKCYQETILLNAYYASPHLALGNLCYKENKISQALLCWNTYLMINPTSDNALKVLIHADKTVATQLNQEPRGISISPDSESFKQADILINSCVSLDKGYEVPINITAPIVKQSFALFEILKSYSGEGGFWSEKYVPMFKKVIDQNYTNLLMYRILSSTDNKKYQKEIAKGAKQMDDFVSWYADEWAVIIGQNNIHADSDLQYFYDSNGEISAIGKNNSEGKGEGAYKYFIDGRLLSMGTMTNDERSGHWTWFYESGEKMEELDYDNSGNPNGKLIKYFPNGQVKSSGTLIGENYQGEYVAFNEYGFQTEQTSYKDDYYHGERTLFHPLGKDYVRLIVPYDNGIVNGRVLKYYPNGNINLDVKYKDDYRTETEIQNFYNGEKSYTYTYGEEGKFEGPYRSYYLSGRVHQEGNYSNDKKSGEWLTYFETGEIGEILNYQDDKLHGDNKKFNLDGSLYYHFVYNKGLINSYAYYAKDSSVLAKADKVSGIIDYISYNANGNIRSKGAYSIRQDQIGK